MTWEETYNKLIRPLTIPSPENLNQAYGQRIAVEYDHVVAIALAAYLAGKEEGRKGNRNAMP